MGKGKPAPQNNKNFNIFSFKTLLIVIIIIILVEFWILIDTPPSVPEFHRESSNIQKVTNERYPLIVLYHGKPVGETIEWNTGVWPGWGEGFYYIILIIIKYYIIIM